MRRKASGCCSGALTREPAVRMAVLAIIRTWGSYGAACACPCSPPRSTAALPTRARAAGNPAAEKVDFKAGSVTELPAVFGERKFASALDSALYHCLDDATNEKYLAALHKQARLPGACLRYHGGSLGCLSPTLPACSNRAHSCMWSIPQPVLPVRLRAGTASDARQAAHLHRPVLQPRRPFGAA